MKLEEQLLEIMKLEGITIEDEKDVLNSLRHKIDNHCISFINNPEGKLIGFYTWRCYEKEGRVDILLNNLVVLNKHKGSFNILSIRQELRRIYNNINSFYWISRKKNVEVSFKERELTCG